jgi:hypothetical protein
MPIRWPMAAAFLLAGKCWLNEKMLFVEVSWGGIAWTDFVLDTETLRFAYIEDGFDYTLIEQQQKRESQEK